MRSKKNYKNIVKEQVEEIYYRQKQEQDLKDAYERYKHSDEQLEDHIEKLRQTRKATNQLKGPMSKAINSMLF